MQRWTVTLEGGPRRVNHAAVAIRDNIFSFGGYCTGEDYERTRPMDVHILDTVSLRWKLLPIPKPTEPQYQVVPYQRYGHTAVAYNKNAYVWGGRNDVDGACSVLFCFDGTKLKWSRPNVEGMIPIARDGHSACVINSKMFIFGGYEEEVDRFSNEIHALDFPSMTWSAIHPKGTPAIWRDFHTATGIGNNMYIFGGRSDEGGNIFTNREIYCNKIQVFDTLTNTWHEPVTSGIQPIGRRSHSAFVYTDNLYIFGGYSGRHDKHYKDVFKFDPVRMQWSTIEVKGEGPCARRRQCCCVIDTKVFLFGGTSPTRPDTGSIDTERDLTDHSDLHVLDFAPSLKMLCQMAVIEHKLEIQCLPRCLRWEISVMTTDNQITKPHNSNG